MFRVLARLLTDPLNLQAAPAPDLLFAVHPLQLSRWLEEAWATSGAQAWPAAPGVLPVFPGDPAVVGAVGLPAPGLLATVPSGIAANHVPPAFANPPALGTNLGFGLPWEHLIYAYLVESTGVVEILAEVARRIVVGETLETASPVTRMWARATEELFFRDPPLFHVTGTVSQLRPDARVNRRNAYWRMFGMDLPHPVPRLEGAPWKADIGAHNDRFSELWIEFLHEIWVGIQNDANTSGANPTNTSHIGYLAESLSEILQLRRRHGLLTREEFGYVTVLSWFHATVETDNAVVVDLQGGAGPAGDPADRLAKIGRRVGITPPRAARELFELANLTSPILRFLEAGRFNLAQDAELLFRAASADPAVREAMNRIIDLWQSATGVNLKSRDVRTTSDRPGGAVPAGASAPLAAPTRAAPAATVSPPPVHGTNGAPARNGHRPAALI